MEALRSENDFLFGFSVEINGKPKLLDNENRLVCSLRVRACLVLILIAGNDECDTKEAFDNSC